MGQQVNEQKHAESVQLNSKVKKYLKWFKIVIFSKKKNIYLNLKKQLKTHKTNHDTQIYSERNKNHKNLANLQTISPFYSNSNEKKMTSDFGSSPAIKHTHLIKASPFSALDMTLLP